MVLEVAEILEKVSARPYVEEHINIKKGWPCCKGAVATGKRRGGVQLLGR
jgi:hypothetical protein